MNSMSRVVFAFSNEEVGLVQEMLTELVRALRTVPGGGKSKKSIGAISTIRFGKPPLGAGAICP